MNCSEQTSVAEAARDLDGRRVLNIEVFFDFICPWCLIGKRNLDTAMSRFAGLRPDVEVWVRWRSQQLLPYTPSGGLPYQAFYRDRLGSAEAVAARRAQVQQTGRAAGIEFAFDQIKVLPNTAAAHDLADFVASSGDEGRHAALIDRLFTAYFTGGEDIGDDAVLERLGRECGLEPYGLKIHLANARRHADPTGRGVPIAAAPVSGVPHFVFGNGPTLSGAHSPEALVEAMVIAVQN
jgi:predicted DsbA family dithiol-disulfide isomerase